MQFLKSPISNTNLLSIFACSAVVSWRSGAQWTKQITCMTCRSFYHFQYTFFFNPLDCDANPCKNGGTCVKVPSTQTYKCNCTDAFTGINCSESTAVAQSVDASREYSKLHFFSSLFPPQRYPTNSTCHSL